MPAKISWQLEWRATMKLAVPVVAVQIGINLMGVVDTLFAGAVGPECLAGVGAGAAVFWGTCMAAIGALAGIDVLSARAHGARDGRRLGSVFLHILAFSGILSLLAVPLVAAVTYYYDRLGGTPLVVAEARNYLVYVLPSLPAVIYYAALQRYWQAREVTLAFAWIIVAANIVNLVGNYALTTGFGPIPALGTRGIALSSVIGRTFMLFALMVMTRKLLPTELSVGLHPWRLISRGWQARDREVWRALWVFGLPAGAQIALEVGAFSIMTTLATRLGVMATAAHQIVLTVASLTFMVPLGLASAGAYRIGHLLGGGRPDAIRRAGWLTLSIGTTFMACSGLVLFFFPEMIFSWFQATPDVLAAGRPILVFAACFQVADGVQAVTTGLLRGVGNTRSSMLANLIGHYPIGLALGVYLCFYRGYNLTGLWAGITAGLVSVAVMLLYMWKRFEVEA